MFECIFTKRRNVKNAYDQIPSSKYYLSTQIHNHSGPESFNREINAKYTIITMHFGFRNKFDCSVVKTTNSYIRIRYLNLQFICN